MGNGRQIFLLLAIAASLIVAAAGFPAGRALAQSETLKVGSDIAYPPFAYYDEETGAPTGFDVEIITAIAKATGMEIEIVHTPWSDSFPDLLSGAIDIVIATMTITEERSMIVDFSAPYFTTGQVIVARADGRRIDASGDMTGVVLAAEVNTTSLEAARTLPGAVVRETKTMADAFAALLAGEVDGVVADEAIARHEVSTHPDTLRIAGAPISVEAYGIAVRKGEAELLARINQGLTTIQADGTYAAIYDRWFGRP